MRRHRGGAERGSASVEFALVLPFVLTLALALLQVGLFVEDRLLVQEAARAGARQASVSLDDASVRQAALGAGGGLDPGRVEVAVSREEGPGMPVSVQVAYAAPVDVPLVSWLFPARISLVGEATMRQETG